MAYSNHLPDHRFDAIHNQLQQLASEQHQRAFESKMASQKNKKRHLRLKACSGKYTGSFQRLLNRWLNNEVTNLFVYDCLKNQSVPDDVTGVDFIKA
ncbi:hypothetical protein AB4571_02680 [Vibrio breoganii]